MCTQIRSRLRLPRDAIASARLGVVHGCPQSAGGDRSVARQTWEAIEFAGLLRGGADRLRVVLATDEAWRSLRCDRALARSDEVGRTREDRSARCRKARAFLSQWGNLTRVWVPDSKHEAIRDLVRAREAAKEDQLRAKHRLSKYLLRYGQRAPATARSIALSTKLPSNCARWSMRFKRSAEWPR